MYPPAGYEMSGNSMYGSLLKEAIKTERRKKSRVSRSKYSGGKYTRYSRLGKRIERKWFDTAKGAFTTSTAGTIADNSLLKIAAGVKESERIGRSLRISKINVKGVVTLPATTSTTQTADVVKIVLYEDKQCNGAAAVVTDMLQTASYFSQNNLSNSHRFQTLASTEVTISSQVALASNTSGTVQVPFTLYKLCNCPIEYKDEFGVIGSLSTRNIGIMVISANGAALVQYTARIRFRD